MKSVFFPLLFCANAISSLTQNIGIGITSPKNSAALDISSPNKGLLIPRTSTSGRTSITAPAKGLMLYDSAFSTFFYYDGGKWRPFYEQNYHSATVDYYNVGGSSVNLPTDASTALGNRSLAGGDYSTGMRESSSAFGFSPTAFGRRLVASGDYSTTMGCSSVAYGKFSTSMGNDNYANGHSSLAVGMYNDSILIRQTNVTSATPLFIIGNGNASSDRSNALVVLKNGNVSIGNNGNPVNLLHITGGTDLNLTDNTGFITLGGVGDSNMVFDNNEIQARNNGATAHLYLQNYGSQVMLGSGTPAHKLTVNGNAYKTNGTSAWEIQSDRRLKKDIEPYTDGLASIMKIKPVWFRYNQVSGFDMQQKNVGILAQKLQTISPYMVS